MEYIPEFAVIQGCLLTLQKKLGVLKSLNKNDEANGKKIEEVVRTIIKTLDSIKNLEENDYNKLRQICLFFVLNSDLKVNEILVEDSHCGHLVDSSPTLSNDILFEVMSQPLLQTFLFELIVFSPPCLSVELIEIATEYLRKTPQISIPQSAFMLVKAVYAKLILLSNKNDSHECSLNCAAFRLFNSYSELLEYFADPKRSEGDHLNNSLSEGLAYLLRSSLDMVSNCLKFYISPINLTDDQLNIYKMNPVYDYSKWHQESNVSYFNAMHEQLFSILVVQIAYVTVDVWIDWAELDSKIIPNYSVQNDIAECMFRCHESILGAQEKGIDSELLKSLLPMLVSMARKPRDEDDEIKEADISMVLKKISDEDCCQKKWLVALFERFNVLSEECIECINKNMSLVDFEVVFLFLQTILNSIKKNTDIKFPEYVKNTFLRSLKHLSLADQLIILEEYVKQSNHYGYLVCENYYATITKCFNTAVDTEVENEKMYEEFVNLSFQNPIDVISRLIKHGISSDIQAQIMGNVLVTLRPLSFLHDNSESFPNIFLQILYEVMETPTNLDFKESSFISLIDLIVSRNIVSPCDYKKFCLLPLLHKSIATENWLNLGLLLQVLQIFVDGTIKFKDTLDTTELLILLAEVLGKSRKNFSTFSGSCVMVTEKVLHLIPIIVESIQGDLQEGSVHKRVLEISCPINVLYFFDLWSNCAQFPEVCIDLKVLLLHSTNLHKWNIQPDYSCYSNESKSVLVGELIQLLPSSTINEWRHITQNFFSLLSPRSVCASPKCVFDLYIDVIQLIILMHSSTNLSEKEKDCALSCIDYCVRNFATIVKEELVRQLHSMSAVDAGALFQKIVFFYHKLPDIVQESCTGVILNVLVELILFAISDMRTYRNHNDNDDDDESQSINLQYEKVFRQMTGSLTSVKNHKLRQVLARKILEGYEMIIG